MSKRILFSAMSFLFLFNSCNVTKRTSSEVSALSAKKVIKAHEKAVFSKNTIQAKIKTRYVDAKTAQSLVIKLRIKKDEVIWMSGSFLGIPLAKLKLTPNSVQYYEKLNKTFFDGDFALISEVLGVDLDFQQLQNIVLGHAAFDFQNRKFKSQVDQSAHLVSPKNQPDLFSFFYWINPKHYKLDQQMLESLEDKQQLTIHYPEYQVVSKELFPKRILINAKQENQSTKIEMDFRNVVFNKKLTFPFSIPSGYSAIKL